MSRPTDDPAWATLANYGAGPYSGNPNKVRPSAGVIAEGLDPNAGMPAEWINYLWANHGTWLKWLLNLPTTSSDAPQFVSQDAAGNNRSLIDHSGYPMGRLSELREDWIGSFSPITAPAAPLTNFPRWSFTNSSTESLTTRAPTATYPSIYMDAATLASIGSQAILYGASYILAPSATMLSFVYECEVGLANIGAAVTYADIALGFNTNSSGSPPYSSSIMLRYSGSGNWIASTSGGGSHDTGIAPTAATDPASGQRFRIEVHGSGSPYGAACRFFINGTLVATLSTGIPSATLFPIFTLKNATGAINHLYVGSVRAVWNRALSIDAL